MPSCRSHCIADPEHGMILYQRVLTWASDSPGLPPSPPYTMLLLIFLRILFFFIWGWGADLRESPPEGSPPWDSIQVKLENKNSIVDGGEGGRTSIFIFLNFFAKYSVRDCRLASELLVLMKKRFCLTGSI